MSPQVAEIESAASTLAEHRILILDFGSQYTQLIARRVREAGVYSEILPWDIGDDAISEFAPDGIILSGGPESVVLTDPPRAPELVFEMSVPVLGICYGMQTMATQLGGQVALSDDREFGYATVTTSGSSRLLKGLADASQQRGNALQVWMSHGDRVQGLPPGFEGIASTANAPLAGMADEQRGFYGLQFHPEVTHTEQGQRIIERFVRDICGCPDAWQPGSIVARDLKIIRDQVGSDRVLLGLSGG
jgi:GMP synthase (glutamine-hydrolysing)